MAAVAAATSSARISDSPIRKHRAPVPAMRARSAGANRPLSATAIRSDGSAGSIAAPTSSEMSIVFRLRLLIPMSGDFRRQARSSSDSSWTSISTSMPSSIAQDSSSSASASSSAAMISRMQSAPSARDSVIWMESIMKSLRSTGRLTAARAAIR